MNIRNISIKYRTVINEHTSLTYFKLESNQVKGSNYLEGYVTDIQDPGLPDYLQQMGIDQQSVNIIELNYNTIGIICNLYVEPKNRNNGIGKALIEYALNEFQTLNIDAVLVVANINNDNSHLSNGLEQWYKNRGFETIAKTNSIPLMVIKLEKFL